MNVAIVCMSRSPDFLLDWVRYHLRVGFCKIYLRLEGENTIEMSQKLQSFPRVDVLETELYPMGDQMIRQCFLVNLAIKKARDESHDLLLHIDDDELFYCPDLQRMLRQMDAVRGWDFLHFSNVEALYPHDQHDTPCFHKTEWFHECTFKEPCRGYGNGKSMVRVDSPRAECFGVHYFKGKGHDVPREKACILHFESCDYDTWKRKFDTFIPSQFPFYKYSHDAVQQCSTSAYPEECEKTLRLAYTSLTNLDSQPSRFHLSLKPLLSDNTHHT